MTVDLGVADLAATRFAVSPLAETISGLQQLAGLWDRAATRPWAAWATAELAREPLRLPATWPLLVHDRPSWPQFLLPAPAGGIDADLAALRRTAARDVRASLRRVFGDDPPPAAAVLAADPAGGLAAVAGELRTAYERLVAPHWPRIRAVLDADVAHRARRLAADGAAGLFDDLHSDLRWRAGRLTVRGSRDRAVVPGPGGLVLVPMVLGPDTVLVKGHTTTRTTVRYPARGVGDLWTAGTRPPPPSTLPAVRSGRALDGGAFPPRRAATSSAPRSGPGTAAPDPRTVRLLGRPRAWLLEALRSPASTVDLARALGVTPSAVSQHLTVLRDSGLVTAERTGRTVLYTTTPRGRELLDP